MSIDCVFSYICQRICLFHQLMSTMMPIACITHKYIYTYSIIIIYGESMQDKEYMRLAGIKFRATAKGKRNILLRHAKNRSIKKNLPFDLDKNWIDIKLKNGKCELSNIDFQFTSDNDLHFNPFSPSIDRVDPKKGYTKDNCVPCCATCNFVKNNMNYGDFIQYIRSLYNKTKWYEMEK